MVNGTISEGVNLILTSNGVPLWIRILAMFGAIYLFHSVTKLCINIPVVIAYIIGFIKFIYNIIKNKNG